MEDINNNTAIEWFTLPPSLQNPGKEYFCFSRQDWEVNRDSSVGDYLVFEKASQIKSGQIGFFKLNDVNLCRKYMEYPDGTVWLLSDLDRNPPVIIKPDDELQVLGLLAYSLNRFDQN